MTSRLVLLTALVLVSGISSSTLADVFNTSGYWRFEEATGNTAIDSGSYGVDGSMNGQTSRSGDVDLAVIPVNEYVNEGSVHLNWVDGSTGGLITVQDPSDVLRMGYNSFTIEAWVKLDYVSTTIGAGQRQWLCQKKPVASAGSELDYGFLVQAGDLGSSGNELVFQCGDGTDTNTILSTLEITDTAWHFVSLTYDFPNQTLRFGIDNVYDTRSFFKPPWPPYGDGSEVYDAGPLLIGGHENVSGAKNQFVRGTIDEVRISRSAIPTTYLLDAPVIDCNENGTPDSLDFFAGASDCNGNFQLDECDLALNPEYDCNTDGIIDTCQVDPYRYRHDDGNGEARVRSDGTYTCWLNRHIVADDVTRVVAIEVEIPEDQFGPTWTIGIWSDPDGDGNPTDAQLLSSIEVPVFDSEGQVLELDIPDVEIGPNGTSFFVGAHTEAAGTFPALLDMDAPHAVEQSWIIGYNQPFDPNDLTANSIEFSTTEAFLPGNWVISAINDDDVIDFEDCNLNNIADTCDIADGRSEDTDFDGFPDECVIPGTYYVPDTFDSVAKAVNVVVSGSEVVVRPGTYVGLVIFDGKSINLRSEAGPEETILDGGGVGPVVAFVNDAPRDAIIDGFTIENGSNGGILCLNASPAILNNVIRDNYHSNESDWNYGGGIVIYNNSSPLLIGNLLEGNSSEYGGAIGISYTLTGDVPELFGNTMRGNTGGSGGAMFIQNGAPVVFGNVMEDNVATSDGGAVMVLNGDNFAVPMQLQIIANTFKNNSCSDDGGAIFSIESTENDPAYYANNLFVGNTGEHGGAIYVRNHALMINNTFSENIATSGGAALYLDGGSGLVEVTNCIIWNNESPGGSQIVDDGGSAQTIDVAYSDIEGGYAGTANIAVDPQFVAPGSDYRLAKGSPCIDSGTDDVVMDGDVDIEGNERIIGAAVDMGCYENTGTPECPADFNSDGIIDGADLTQLLGSWGSGGPTDLDGNGFTDGGDLAVLLGAWGSC